MEDSAVSTFVTLAEGTIASDYALKHLNKSLGEAQAEFLPASKGEENKWGGYKYTSLENIIKAARPSLTKHHLTISQFPVVDLELKTVRLVTRLVHWDSGEWMQHNLDIPAELALGKDGAPKFNQQTIGGSSTYAQKYAYKTILGIPDSEEMIDSTEEKGDLPARAKAPKQQSPQVNVQAKYEPAPQPAQPILPKEFPSSDKQAEWKQAMGEASTVEQFNKFIVPLAKENGKEFVVLMATEAKQRGYKADRSTGLYVEGAA